MVIILKSDKNPGIRTKMWAPELICSLKVPNSRVYSGKSEQSVMLTKNTSPY